METLRPLLAGTPAGQALLEALEPHSGSSLPGLVLAVLQERAPAAPAAAAASEPPRASLEEAASVLKHLQFLTPRGRQDLAFFEERFLVKTSKSDLAVPYSAIRHLVIIEMPKDPKKRVFLFLDIDASAKVVNGKQPVTAVVIQTTSDATLEMAHPKAEGEVLSGPAAVVLCQAFGMHGLPAEAFVSPDGETFRSAGGSVVDAAGGTIGVQAYVKASQGLLYPMPAGLCFLERPALFIARRDIRCVELTRAGGTSSTFDLHVHKRDGSSQEFSNISREEIGAFQDFLRRTRLPLGPPPEGSDGEVAAEASGASCSEESGSGSDSDDDSEDEDFDPSGSSSSEGEDEEGEEGGAAAGATASGRAGSAGGPSGSTAGKRKRAGSSTTGGSSRGGGGPAAASDEGGSEDDDDDEEYTSEEDSSGSDSDSEGGDSDGDGSVELVSEDDMSVGQLHSAIASEGGPKPKKQRR